jgi:hypothetical protein
MWGNVVGDAHLTTSLVCLAFELKRRLVTLRVLSVTGTYMMITAPDGLRYRAQELVTGRTQWNGCTWRGVGYATRKYMRSLCWLLDDCLVVSCVNAWRLVQSGVTGDGASSDVASVALRTVGSRNYRRVGGFPTPPPRGDCCSMDEACGEVDVTAGTRSAGRWVRWEVLVWPQGCCRKVWNRPR